MLGTNASKIRDNLRYLGQYVYNKPADQSSTTNANNDAAKRSISGDRLWFNFSDGKYLDTDEQNLGIARRLKNASDLVRANDEDRKNNLLKYINGKIQTIITTTDIDNIDNKTLKKARVFEISSGKVLRRKDDRNG